MDEVLKVANEISKQKIIIAVVIILVLYISYRCIIKGINKYIELNKNNEKITKKKRTYIRLIKNVLKYIFFIIALIIVLQLNGINVTSLIAGVGVISVIVGLALQDAFKDIIMGFNIIMDDYFSVGDVIKIGDTEGKVIELGLKATKLKDVNNENILIVANSTISKALNISNQLDIDIPLSYNEKLVKVEKVLEEAVEKIKKEKNVINAEYKGLNEFASSSICYKVRIWCKPEYKPQIRRNSNRIIKVLLDENNMEIPFNQLVVHNENN